MTFKNHACCGHTFAAIDGALALRKRMGVQPQDIQKLEVGTYRAGVEVAHYESPRTPAEGRFSLKYVVARRSRMAACASPPSRASGCRIRRRAR